MPKTILSAPSTLHKASSDSDGRNQRAVAAFRQASEQLGIGLPDLEGGERVFVLRAADCDLEVLICVENGRVTEFSADDRSASHPEYEKLWLALIHDVGMVMIPTSGGPAYASASVTEMAPDFSDQEMFPEGITLVTSRDHLPWP